MTEKTMSVHQALAEIKMYDNKIYRATMQTFVSAGRKGNEKIGSETKEEFSNSIKGNFDSVVALIENKKAIKSAIVLSNANTKVNIGGIEYTVAEAIERKAMITHEKQFLNSLKQQYRMANDKVESENNSLQPRLESYLKSVINEKDKNDIETVKMYEKQFRDVNEYELIDPCKVRNYIENLEKSIEDFETEVDYKLSESNTVTQITVNLA